MICLSYSALIVRIVCQVALKYYRTMIVGLNRNKIRIVFLAYFWKFFRVVNIYTGHPRDSADIA